MLLSSYVLLCYVTITSCVNELYMYDVSCTRRHHLRCAGLVGVRDDELVLDDDATRREADIFDRADYAATDEIRQCFAAQRNLKPKHSSHKHQTQDPEPSELIQGKSQQRAS